MIIGQWLAHDSPTPDQSSTAYGFSACVWEQRVSADEKVGCAGWQASLVRSIALFVLHVYCNMPSSISTLWTPARSHWFRKWVQENTTWPSRMDVARLVPVALTCRQAGEYGTMHAHLRTVAVRLRPRVGWEAASSGLQSLECGQEAAKYR
jgi:hypothetical protein